MRQWMNVFFVVILCIGGSAFAEDITYDDESQIPWAIEFQNLAGQVHTRLTGTALLGPVGNPLGDARSISGNTVTIKNITASLPDDDTDGHGDIAVVGGLGGLNGSDAFINWHSHYYADPVVGNTVILDNAKLDNPKMHSKVHGGYSDNFRVYRSLMPSYSENQTGGLGGEHNSYEVYLALTINRLLGNPVASTNHVTIKNGSTVNEVTGGYAGIDIAVPYFLDNPLVEGDLEWEGEDPIAGEDLPGVTDFSEYPAIATATANRVTIERGTVGGAITGGDASILTTIQPDLSELNSFDYIFDGSIFHFPASDIFYMGRPPGIDLSDFDFTSFTDITATALAQNNHIEIAGDNTVLKGEIRGGHSSIGGIYSTDSTATADSNSVTINGGTVTLEDDAIMGGLATANGYEEHHTLYDRETDTYSEIDIDITDNAASAIATGNAVAINGGTVSVEGYGIIGGMADSDSGVAVATHNTVAISGGTVNGNVYGGFAASDSGVATATNNTVTVSGTANLSNASLFGGGTLDELDGSHADSDFFTGNTLNKTSDINVRDAQNFQYVNFTYSGDANIGTLDTTGGTVELNTNSYDIDFGGSIVGTGSLAKFGAGAFTYGGSINIDGSVSVRGGSFVINENKSLTAGGGLLFGAGSVFTPNGNKLTVIGGVAIDEGARLNLSDIDIGKTILASNDGIDGFFDFDSMFYQTEMNSALTELSVIGEFSAGDKGKNIIADLANSGVTVGKNGAKGIGQLASILDSVSPAVEAELMTRLQELVKLADSGDTAAAAAGVQQIIGQYSTRATQATYTVAQSFGSAISGHLSQMRDTRMAMNETGAPGARSNAAYASLRDPRGYRSARGGYGYSAASQRIWGAGFGSFARQDNDDGEFGYDYDAGGFILGYDHYFGDNITVGVSGAYSHGRIDGNDGLSETDVDTLNFGLYASYDTNRGFFAEANLGFGFTWNDEDERIVGGGRRGGEFETSSFQLGGTAGYAFRLPAAIRIIPTLGLQYIHVDQDEYAQSGNILAMWRDSSSADYLEVPIAVHVDKTFELGGGVSVTPELRAAWIIEAMQDDVSVRTGFVGSNASMFVSGTNPGKHRGLVGAGVKARLHNSVDAFLNYNLEFRNRYTNHNIMAGVGVSF